MQYYTVKNATPADKAASSSFFAGTDDQGVDWALCKIATGTPVPAWEGEAIELDAEEASSASQSDLYTGTGAGVLYHDEAVRFGNMLVTIFVNGAAALTAEQSDIVLGRLSNALAAAKQGYITTMRHNLDAASTITPGYTQPQKDALLQLTDQWLLKFPGKGGTPPATLVECLTISDGDDGKTLDAGREYTCNSINSTAMTVSLPAMSDMLYPGGWVRVQNFSAQSLTLDAGAIQLFPGGATSVDLQGGESILIRSARDNGTNIFAAILS